MKVLYANNAEGLTAAGSSGHNLILATGQGALFPSIPEEGGYFFYVRVGTNESNTVYTVINRVDDELTTVEYLEEYAAEVPVKLTVCAELLDHFAQEYDGDVFVIDSVEGDFSTWGSFESVLSELNLIGTVVADLRGIHSIILDDREFRSSEKIKISGHRVDVTIDSVQSSSGSAGDYSVVLNVESVTGLLEGHVLLCYPGLLTGGTNPSYLSGAHLITNVDAVNDRITINLRSSLGVPSGAVSGDVVVFTTVVDQIILAGKGFNSIENVAVVANDEIGLRITDTFTGNFYEGGEIVIINSTSSGVYLENTRAYLNIGLTITGCLTGINSINSILYCNPIIINCENAFNVSQGILDCYVLYIMGCTEGIHVTHGASARLQVGDDFGATIDHVTNIAIKASRYGYIEVVDPVLSNNGTDYSPALNTQGNKYGYIDDGT
jgi:hypothetical protein